jgi:hypothetical protein
MWELCRERKGGTGTLKHPSGSDMVKIASLDMVKIAFINLIQNHVNRTIGMYTNNPIKQQPSMVP